MELHTIGIDLGKTVFHLVGLNLRGEVVVRKKFSRKQLLHFTANLRVELIGMEACGGAHFLGRAPLWWLRIASWLSHALRPEDCFVRCCKTARAPWMKSFRK